MVYYSHVVMRCIFFPLHVKEYFIYPYNIELFKIIESLNILSDLSAGIHCYYKISVINRSKHFLLLNLSEEMNIYL